MVETSKWSTYINTAVIVLNCSVKEPYKVVSGCHHIPIISVFTGLELQLLSGWVVLVV